MRSDVEKSKTVMSGFVILIFGVIFSEHTIDLYFRGIPEHTFSQNHRTALLQTEMTNFFSSNTRISAQLVHNFFHNSIFKVENSALFLEAANGALQSQLNNWDVSNYNLLCDLLRDTDNN